MNTLHIITSCSQRKSLDPVPSTRLGQFAHIEQLADRCDAWFESLGSYQGDKKPSIDLYQGDHWSSSVAATEIARGQDVGVALWVCSAGFGLIPGEAELPPYAATFSTNSPNTISRNLENVGDPSFANRQWWSLLAEKEFGEKPRSLSELFEAYSSDTFVLILSQTYMNAVSDDLREALPKLSAQGDCAVFSVGGGGGEGLEPYVVPGDARLQREVGGTLTALNARFARRCLDSIPASAWNSSAWKQFAADLMEQLPPYSSPKRTPMSDDEVLEFITTALQDDPSWSKTRLLRHLRQVEGKACEQKRFGNLFKGVKSG